MTALYRFQKSINKGNTQVNSSLLELTYFYPISCPSSCQGRINHMAETEYAAGPALLGILEGPALSLN